MSVNPYGSPNATGESSAQGKRSRIGCVVKVLVTVCVVGLVIALLIPSMRFSRPAARRMQCSNNLKQIALALQNYESEYHALPPACTVDAEGKPLHSWRTLILPYLEQRVLYETIDLSKPWDDPANQVARETRIPTYVCPSTDCPPNHTTYLAIVAPGNCLKPTEPRKLSEITDDRNLTLMVLEVDSEHSVQWMAPADVGEQWVAGLGAHANQPHPSGAQAVCVGANVLHLGPSTKTETLHALISIAGHDDAVAREAE